MDAAAGGVRRHGDEDHHADEDHDAVVIGRRQGGQPRDRHRRPAADGRDRSWQAAGQDGAAGGQPARRGPVERRHGAGAHGQRAEQHVRPPGAPEREQRAHGGARGLRHGGQARGHRGPGRGGRHAGRHGRGPRRGRPRVRRVRHRRGHGHEDVAARRRDGHHAHQHGRPRGGRGHGRGHHTEEHVQARVVHPEQTRVVLAGRRRRVGRQGPRLSRVTAAGRAFLIVDRRVA